MVKAIILHFTITYFRLKFINKTNKSFQIRVKSVRYLSLRLHELFYKINIIFKNILDLNS